MLTFDTLPSKLYGNNTVREELWRRYRDQSLNHHALIFQGIAGVGKATFAAQLSAVLLGAAKLHSDNSLSLATETPALRQLYNRSHPDFCYLSAKNFNNRSGSIPTEARDILLPFLARSGDSPRRIVLIDSVDDCAPQLLQALLKQLEEPPAKVLFFLIVHQAARLPTTIRSRAQHYSFKPLDDQAMQKACTMISGNHDEQNMRYCQFLADGVPGMMPTLLDADFPTIERTLLDMLKQPDHNSTTLHDFAALISHPQHEHLVAFRWWWQKIILWSQRRALGLQHAEIPSSLIPIVQHFAPILANNFATPYKQERFEYAAKLLQQIQQPPCYLDAEATMMHIAYIWHQLFADAPQS